MAYHISRAAEREWVDVKEVPGLRQALMVGERHGSHHMEISLYELAPGATLGWNRCPFEESWFITAGNGRAALAGLEYDLGSVRVPPFVAFLAFSALFGLGLLCLHWREKDLAAAKEAAEAAKRPEPVPAPDDPELAKV